MNNNFEKPDRLDEVEKKLNSPNQVIGIRTRKPLREETYETPRDWQSPHANTQESPLALDGKKTNWFFRFFIIAFIFFLGALGYLGYKFYFDGGIDVKNVDILINAPLTIGAGEVLDFEVVMQNKNQVGMRYIDVEVDFPDGTRSVQDIGSNYEIDNQAVDMLEVGGIVKKNYSALLFGEEGDKKEITILLTYQIDGSTTLFKKEKKFDVVLKSTPVRLTITNVREITSGQELSFNVELVSNSTQTLKNVLVEAKYPFGFTFKSSSFAPQAGKDTWIIPTLAPKEVATFTIKGTLEGQNNDEKFFNFSTGLATDDSNTPQIVFSTKGTTVTLARPFLELDLAIDKDNSDIIVLNPERSGNATVSFKNNTNFQLRNTSISLTIDGAALNEDSVQVSEGFYQSANNTVTWDNTTSSELVSIPVGSSGAVTFNFRGLGLLSSFFIQNPELTLTVQVKGNRNPENQVPEIIENTIVKKIRFNTQLALETSSQHYSSVFANSGPIPPKVEQKTTYTGLIKLQNTTSKISNGIVSMRIPNYAQYEGVFSPASEKVSYDSVTRILSWNVGDIGPKVGYLGTSPRTLAVQVSIIPSISQVNTTPELIENIRFTGTDSHTQEDIIRTAQSISTQISDSKEYYDSQVSR